MITPFLLSFDPITTFIQSYHIYIWLKIELFWSRESSYSKAWMGFIRSEKQSQESQLLDTENSGKKRLIRIELFSLPTKSETWIKGNTMKVICVERERERGCLVFQGLSYSRKQVLENNFSASVCGSPLSSSFSCYPLLTASLCVILLPDKSLLHLRLLFSLPFPLLSFRRKEHQSEHTS